MGNSMFSRKRKFPCNFFSALMLFLFFSGPFYGLSQSELQPEKIKKLSLEELMDMEVTMVSRTPQKLGESASAIQVISGADIRRSGATNIPDALRLVCNLQVAQLSANAWIIGSRGFNTVFANKLLVMLDGRTVYTPLFGGVIWELQNILLEDVDRIEVVSGPGGTMWGANAVNGVINIITKSVKETQGSYLSASVGSFVKNTVTARYGGSIGKNLYYRAYAQHFDRNPTLLTNGSDNTDAWGLTQGGLRMDWNASASDTLTLQGDLYAGKRKTVGGKSALNGQNLLGRWSHSISNKSDLAVQVYFDRYFRDDIPSQGSDKLTTFDIDFQHRFPIKNKQSIVWGLGARLVTDFANYRTTQVGILPPKKELSLFQGFIQDEITLHDRLKLTLGSKLLHNNYSGFEIQPNARMAFTVRKTTLWAAVSRAVRTPSRFDRDYFLPAYLVPPPNPSVAGGPNFVSEKLLAYELGYRLQPVRRYSFSIATFYNLYYDLYSVEPIPGTLTYQIQNGSEGRSWGAEISGTYQVADSWKLRGGYTYFDKKLKSKPGHTFTPDYLGNDVKNQALLQSILDLPFHLQFDMVTRYLSHLSKTLATNAVPAYFTFDARIAYAYKGFELSVVGQNLGDNKHSEYDVLSIPRSIYAKITCKF